MLTIILKTDYQREGRSHSVSIPITSSVRENYRQLDCLMEFITEFSKKFIELPKQTTIIKLDSVATVRNIVTSEISQLPISQLPTSLNRSTESKNKERKFPTSSKISIYPTNGPTQTANTYSVNNNLHNQNQQPQFLQSALMTTPTTVYQQQQPSSIQPMGTPFSIGTLPPATATIVSSSVAATKNPLVANIPEYQTLSQITNETITSTLQDAIDLNDLTTMDFNPLSNVSSRFELLTPE